MLRFYFVEQPDALTLKDAEKILEAIHDGGLTARGKILATLLIDPQLGKMLLGGCDDGIGDRS